jgi:hypothetical protein
MRLDHMKLNGRMKVKEWQKSTWQPLVVVR